MMMSYNLNSGQSQHEVQGMGSDHVSIVTMRAADQQPAIMQQRMFHRGGNK